MTDYYFVSNFFQKKIKFNKKRIKFINELKETIFPIATRRFG